MAIRIILGLVLLFVFGPASLRAQGPPIVAHGEESAIEEGSGGNTEAAPPIAPVYSADSIAHSAANVTNWYAPNTFISIYGQNLGFTTRTISITDISGGTLPTALPGTGVRVLINSIPAYMYYVSPSQVNVLIPYLLAPGAATLQLEVNGVAGPPVQILLRDTAPGLFTQADNTTVLAVHGDWTLVTEENPARKGEVIILFATGLGQTNPTTISGQLPQGARQIRDKLNFQVWLDSAALDASAIDYAGVMPGYAGVYQINVALPSENLPHNPEVRISTGSLISPAQKFLPTE
jgi:uncharacterized protein (TIGR03437 family)